jgi:hypothetical protein
MARNDTTIPQLLSLGIAWDDAQALRRISMQLRRWHELECGTDRGAVERDETTGKTYWLNSLTGRRFPCADRETGARRRLDKIAARYHHKFRPYIQGDPRGCALYLLRPDDVPDGADDGACYSRGIAVY